MPGLLRDQAEFAFKQAYEIAFKHGLEEGAKFAAAMIRSDVTDILDGVDPKDLR